MTKILLVEDQPLIATSTGFVLEGEGYEVRVALDGREGLEMVRTESPDLIITTSAIRIRFTRDRPRP
jgi:two-component system alkaline phosphatase synthesis response regulator PhoP